MGPSFRVALRGAPWATACIIGPSVSTRTSIRTSAQADGLVTGTPCSGRGPRAGVGTPSSLRLASGSAAPGIGPGDPGGAIAPPGTPTSGGGALARPTASGGRGALVEGAGARGAARGPRVSVLSAGPSKEAEGGADVGRGTGKAGRETAPARAAPRGGPSERGA